MWVHCFIVLIVQKGEENHREIKATTQGHFVN